MYVKFSFTAMYLHYNAHNYVMVDNSGWHQIHPWNNFDGFSMGKGSQTWMYE